MDRLELARFILLGMMITKLECSSDENLTVKLNKDVQKKPIKDNKQESCSEYAFELFNSIYKSIE